MEICRKVNLNMPGSDSWMGLDVVCFLITLPKTNIAPENRPLEKGIPIGNHHFQVLC